MNIQEKIETIKKENMKKETRIKELDRIIRQGNMEIQQLANELNYNNGMIKAYFDFIPEEVKNQK